MINDLLFKAIVCAPFAIILFAICYLTDREAMENEELAERINEMRGRELMKIFGKDMK